VVKKTNTNGWKKRWVKGEEGIYCCGGVDGTGTRKVW
jgi:hypothetical protein